MTRHFNKLVLARATSRAELIVADFAQDKAPRRPSLRVGLVNNMPDGALLATERQFATLLSNATQGSGRLELFHLPSLPRSDAAAQILAQNYKPVSDLFHTGIDALIVTGNEPRAARLDQEAYWADMTRLIDWAAQHTQTTFWSCLAAHAAVLHMDQIERRRLPAKRSGVYECTTDFARAENPRPFLMCHSRLNDVEGGELEAAGYRILSRNETGEVDAFMKDVPSRFLFLQGHPEYDAHSLAREYRRDVERYLAGSRDQYPAMPENYFDATSSARFSEFRKRTEIEPRPEMIADFPEPALREGLAPDLASSAADIFSFWVAQMLESKSKKALSV